MTGSRDVTSPCPFLIIKEAFRFLPVHPRTASDVLMLPIDTLRFIATTRQVVPSSPFLAAAMTDPLRLERSKVVVEFGAGTGSITYELLKRMPDTSRLFAFELNESLARQLRRNIVDHRLFVIEKTVETCGEILRQHHVRTVDAVASSVGLTIMSGHTRNSTFESIARFLNHDSVLTQLQYLNAMQISKTGIRAFDAMAFLKRHFPDVSRHSVLLNLPPVNVFVCRKSTTNP